VAVFVRLRGRSDYRDVHRLQERLVADRATGAIPDVVLLLEHTEVITLGRAKGAEASVLDAGDVPVVPIERGGDATWHGPGQLVAYPIVKLEGRRADLHLHLHSLEDAVMAWLADHGLDGHRDPRNTGVWLSADGEVRKVCSIGIACRRWVSWHGLALNLNPDPSGFARIRPCGFASDVMTRVVDHLGWAPGVPASMPALARHLAEALELPFDGHVVAVDGPDDVLSLLATGGAAVAE
jgi:lipoyl(octanoyl) transferase